MTVQIQLEKHEPAGWVVERLNSFGGFNRYGEPNFRVVWGGNRRHTVGGMFKAVLTVKDENGGERPIVTQVAETRQMLAYHPHRWHLERWRPPEYYGAPEEWYTNTWDEEAKLHRMGAYPERGDYEHVFYLGICNHMQPGDLEWCGLCKVNCGEYIPLEENVHILEQHIRALLLSEDVSDAAEKSALFLREDLKRQANRKRIQMIVQNAMRPHLATQPTSWQPGTGGKCSVPEARFDRELKLPRNRRGFSQSMGTMPDKKQEELEN